MQKMSIDSPVLLGVANVVRREHVPGGIVAVFVARCHASLFPSVSRIPSDDSSLEPTLSLSLKINLKPSDIIILLQKKKNYFAYTPTAPTSLLQPRPTDERKKTSEAHGFPPIRVLDSSASSPPIDGEREREKKIEEVWLPR